MPAHERGQAEVRRAQRDLRLEQHRQDVVVEGLSQGAGKHGVAARLIVVPLVMQPAAMAARHLRPSQRGLRKHQQAVAVAGIAWEQRGAGAGRDRERLATDLDRCRHGRQQLVGHQPGMLGPGQVLDDHREPIGRPAGKGVALAQLPLQARADQAQQRIARSAIEPPVHQVEAVEIEHHDRGQRALAARACQRPVQPIAEQGGAWQSGQAVARDGALQPRRAAPARERHADRPFQTLDVQLLLVEHVGGTCRHGSRGEPGRHAVAEQDDGHASATAGGQPGRRQPVPGGQPVVDQPDIVPAGEQCCEAVLQVGDMLDGKAGLLGPPEQVTHDQHVVLVVVDQQHPDDRAWPVVLVVLRPAAQMSAEPDDRVPHRCAVELPATSRLGQAVVSRWAPVAVRHGQTSTRSCLHSITYI